MPPFAKQRVLEAIAGLRYSPLVDKWRMGQSPEDNKDCECWKPWVLTSEQKSGIVKGNKEGG